MVRRRRRVDKRPVHFPDRAGKSEPQGCIPRDNSARHCNPSVGSGFLAFLSTWSAVVAEDLRSRRNASKESRVNSQEVCPQPATHQRFSLPSLNHVAPSHCRCRPPGRRLLFHACLPPGTFFRNRPPLNSADPGPFCSTNSSGSSGRIDLSCLLAPRPSRQALRSRGFGSRNLAGSMEMSSTSNLGLRRPSCLARPRLHGTSWRSVAPSSLRGRALSWVASFSLEVCGD